jgi:hypothetical protein
VSKLIPEKKNHDRLLPNPYHFTGYDHTASLDLQETRRLKERFCQTAQQSITNQNQACNTFEKLTGEEKQEMSAITAGDTH